MAMMHLAVLLAVVAGSIVAADDALAAVLADPKASTAVGKIVTLLTDTRNEAEEELYQEEKTYTKFEHFCADTIEEKTAAISKGDLRQEALEATIADQKAKIAARTAAIEEAEEAIAGLEEEIAKLVKARGDAKAIYQTNSRDMDTAIEALENAVRSVQNSKEPVSFLQLPEVKKAAALANFLGLGSRAAEKLLFHEEETDTAKAKDTGDEDTGELREIGSSASEMQETLETFREELRDARNDADMEEMKAKSAFASAKQRKEFAVAAQKKILDDNEALLGTAKSKKASADHNLAVTKKNLKDDNAYKSETESLRKDKKAAWDQRSATRKGEIEAIDEAITIMKEGMAVNASQDQEGLLATSSSVQIAKRQISSHRDALLLAEAAAEAAEAPSRNLRAGFLQLRSVESKRKTPSGTSLAQKIASMLRSKSIELKSPALLAVSRETAAMKEEDPLAEIKALLGNVVKDLESQNEDKLIYCEEETKKQEGKRDTADTEVTNRNNNMAAAEAERDKQMELFEQYDAEMDALEAEKAKAQAIRDQEKANNDHAEAEATAGKEAVANAIEVLKLFYDGAKEKTAVEHSEDVGKESSVDKDAPDAGFDSGKAYQGSGQSASIFGMLEVILSDFTETLTETKANEIKAAADHKTFLDDNAAEYKDKEDDKKEANSAKVAAEEELIKDGEALKVQSEALMNALTQLAILNKDCLVQGQAEDRIEKRKAEMDALKEGIEYLDKMFPNLSSA